MQKCQSKLYSISTFQYHIELTIVMLFIRNKSDATWTLLHKERVCIGELCDSVTFTNTALKQLGIWPKLSWLY